MPEETGASGVEPSSDALRQAVGALRAMLAARENDSDRAPEAGETASEPDAS